jgi:hypothetical protein
MEEKKPETPDILAVCKKCGETKVRNPAGKFHNGRDKRFVDSEGKLWNGLTCSNCQAKKMKSHMKVKRSKKLQ